jgi:hypothetical protein
MKKNMKDKIRCCNRHEKNVKLISTFAFIGAEYWCPYCGANYGYLGAGRMVEYDENIELEHLVKFGRV